jgi:hypothetical protein
MSTDELALLSKIIFGGSICLILYIIYFEWRTAQINAEKAQIALGEKENEDRVNSLTPDELLDLVNGIEPGSTKGSSDPKK